MQYLYPGSTNPGAMEGIVSSARTEPLPCVIMFDHMNKLLLIILCCLFVVASLVGVSVAVEQSPFDILKDTAVGLFKPLSGTITTIQGKTLNTDIPGSSGIKPGMRLDIYRRGTPFTHPVTKVTMGFSEKLVGRAETSSVDETGTKLRLISGEAMTGDIVRISDARVQVLYYPVPEVSWSIAEEFYLKLRESGRFDIAEIPLNSIKKSEDILVRARELGAIAIIFISSEVKEGDTILHQRILWSEDGATLSDTIATVSATVSSSLALGETLFSPKEQLPIYNFSLPNTYKILTVGDFDGDGKKELALGLEREIDFFWMGIELTPALDGIRLKVPGRGINTRLYATDLDGDKKDELIVSAMGDITASSYIFKYDGREFKPIWNGPAFLRLLDGVLYGQSFSKNSGYTGDIFPVLWDKGEAYKGSPALDTPPGTALDSFYPVTTGGIRMYFTYVNGGFLALKDQKGLQIWKSVEFYSSSDEVMEEEAPPLAYIQFKPPIMDRMTSLGDSVLAVRRVPIVTQFKGLGNYSSQLMRVFPTGANVTEGLLIKGIPGTVIDHVVADGNIILLSSTWAISPENVLHMRTIFDVKLLLFKLKG